MKRKLAIVFFLLALITGLIGLTGCDEPENTEGGTDQTQTQTHKHTLEHVEAVPATCTEDGNIEYWYCTECKKCFTDREAENETDSVVIAATGHTYSEDWDSDETYHWHRATCVHTEEVSDKAEHSFQNGVCEVCGYELYDAAGFAYILTEDGAAYEVDKYYGTDTEVTIPSEYRGLPVIGIRQGVFENCGQIRTMVVPESIENIAIGAFFECSSLEKITLPFIGEMKDGSGSLYFGSIFGTASPAGDTTFDYLPRSLRSIVITGGTAVGEGAFAYCSQVTQIVLPDGTESIGENAFHECSSLTDFAIPENVKSIGAGAFSGCEALQSATVPGGVKVINNNVFSSCTGLKNLTIEEGVQEIDWYAFDRCTGLTKIVIPDSVTRVDESAFIYCDGLKEVTVPFIGTGSAQTDLHEFGKVFGSTQIEKVTLTQGERIYNNAFSSCEGIVEIVLPGTIRFIEDSAFLSCKALQKIDIPEAVESIGNNAFYGCESLPEIALPRELNSIGSHAFADCASLREIDIPESVTSIGESAFRGCSSLEKLTVPFIGESENGEKQYLGYFFEATSNLQPGQNAPETLHTVIVKGGNALADYAFSECSQLQSITLPESITQFGAYTFAGCSQLQSFNFPSGLKSIGERAFRRCESLEKILLPNGLETIGEAAFSGCKAEIEWGDSPTIQEIASYTFVDYKGTQLSIPDCVEVIQNGAFNACNSLESIELPFVGMRKDGTATGDAAYFDYVFGGLVPSSLKTVVIRGGERIAWDAFDDSCESFVSLTLPFVGETADSTENTWFGYIYGATSYLENGQNVPAALQNVTILGGTRIAANAFYGCSSIRSLIIPDTLNTIGSNAFYRCTGLERIDYEGNLESWCGINGLGNLMERGRLLRIGGTELSGVLEIPETIGYIASYAFAYCDGITQVKLSEKIASIGTDAFFGCSSLTSVVYAGDIAGWCGISGLGNIMTSDRELSVGGNTLSGKLVIPEGTGKISDYAFYGCGGITSVVLPEDIEEIGRDAFDACDALSAIEYAGDVSAWCGIEGLGNIMSSGRTLFIGGEEPAGELVIGGVGKIADHAFYGCKALTSVILSDGVTSVGSNAFGDCGGLAAVYYKGTQESWDLISIGSANGDLTEAARYYYLETEPAEDGDFWHYAEDGVTPVVWPKWSEE